MPVYDGCKLITCLTPYYMTIMKEKDFSLYEEFDYITSDGISPLMINDFVGRPKSLRLSFDMSSMASPIFLDMIKHDKSLYVLGAKRDEISSSIRTIQSFFPKLKIAGYHHGYIKNQEDVIIKQIIESEAKVCIIGMGAPLQDEMAVRLKRAGYIGSVYTCGGFIHQTTGKIHSFPEWTNKYNVRFFYRWFHEKGVFSRTPRQIWGLIRYGFWLKFKYK